MADTQKDGVNEMGSCQRKDHFIWALRVADASQGDGTDKGEDLSGIHGVRENDCQSKRKAAQRAAVAAGTLGGPALHSSSPSGMLKGRLKQ